MRLGIKRRQKSSFAKITYVTLLSALLTYGLLGCVSQWHRGFQQQDFSDVRFMYIDPDARSVCVAGNFNGWSKESSCMKKSGKTWSTEIEMPPGRYQYLFLVDGQKWRQDPTVLLHESNGFGGENSVLIVN